MKRLLPFLLLLISSATLAESGAYRVEVIIFRNLLVTAQASSVRELRSFSHYPDLEDARPSEDAVEGPIQKQTTDLPNSLADVSVDGLPDALADVLRDDMPDDLHVSFERGTYMDDVWRRLRSSEGYRPWIYASWEQNRVDYYPPMRIHNQQILDTQLRPPSHILIADLTADDPLSAYRNHFYQLDGSVQLRRSRFLHLFLDLEYRQERVQGTAEDSIPANHDFLTGARQEASDRADYGVFTLKQNRQIRSNQMQYFDTPYFGALVLVTSITAPDPAIQ